MSVKDINDYAAVTKAFDPIRKVARETDSHILLVHHMGKGERRGGDAILGSTALEATVDTALLLQEAGDHRTLSSRQRYGSPLAEQMLVWEPATQTVYLGGSKDHRLDLRAAEALVTFLQSQGDAVTEETLTRKVGGRKESKERALRALVEAAVVEKLGSGVKNDPY